MFALTTTPVSSHRGQWQTGSGSKALPSTSAHWNWYRVFVARRVRLALGLCFRRTRPNGSKWPFHQPPLRFNEHCVSTSPWAGTPTRINDLDKVARYHFVGSVMRLPSSLEVFWPVYPLYSDKDLMRVSGSNFTHHGDPAIPQLRRKRYNAIAIAIAR
jgi:hypothetical protein